MFYVVYLEGFYLFSLLREGVVGGSTYGSCRVFSRLFISLSMTNERYFSTGLEGQCAGGQSFVWTFVWHVSFPSISFFFLPQIKKAKERVNWHRW